MPDSQSYPTRLWRCFRGIETGKPPASLSGAPDEGGTLPEAYVLRHHADLEITARSMVFGWHAEHHQTWYGFDTKEKALAADAKVWGGMPGDEPGGAYRPLELRRYRVHTATPIRPYDRTPRLDPDEAVRLSEVCLEAGLAAREIPDDEREALATAVREIAALRAYSKRRLSLPERLSHYQLWVLAARAVDLSTLFPLPYKEPDTLDELLRPQEEERMGAVLMAMGFDAVHVCPERGEWWLLETWMRDSPEKRPEHQETTIIPPTQPTN